MWSANFTDEHLASIASSLSRKDSELTNKQRRLLTKLFSTPSHRLSTEAIELKGKVIAAVVNTDIKLNKPRKIPSKKRAIKAWSNGKVVGEYFIFAREIYGKIKLDIPHPEGKYQVFIKRSKTGLPKGKILFIKPCDEKMA